AAQVAAEAGEEAEYAGAGRNVGDRRLADRAAVLGGQQASPALRIGFDRVGEAPEGRLALCRGRTAPAVERLRGAGDGPLDVGGARLGDLRPGLAGARLDRLEAPVRGQLLAADLQPEWPAGSERLAAGSAHQKSPGRVWEIRIATA